jgi:hypothetical protein
VSGTGYNAKLGRGLPFSNALAGLTTFDRDGVTERISAYRFHANDPLFFEDGGGLSHRP